MTVPGVPGFAGLMALVLHAIAGAGWATEPGASHETVTELSGSDPHVRCTCSGAVPEAGIGTVGPSAKASPVSNQKPSPRELTPAARPSPRLPLRNPLRLKPPETIERSRSFTASNVGSPGESTLAPALPRTVLLVTSGPSPDPSSYRVPSATATTPRRHGGVTPTSPSGASAPAPGWGMTAWVDPGLYPVARAAVAAPHGTTAK